VQKRLFLRSHCPFAFHQRAYQLFTVRPLRWNFKEQRYRQQFEKPFPFLDFNKELALSHGGNWFVIAFDPISISRYLVADAWSSKNPFVDQIKALEMHLISRLRYYYFKDLYFSIIQLIFNISAFSRFLSEQFIHINRR